MGNWIIFWLLCLTVIGIPIAILYLINSTVRLESCLKDPELFVQEFRDGKLSKRQ